MGEWNLFWNCNKCKEIKDQKLNVKFQPLSVRRGRPINPIYAEGVVDFIQEDLDVDFRVLDITSDEIPPGDVCFVRQVLQHLSNQSIINLGEIAYWVEGSSIAIGFGPTPISKADEIRLVTKANIIGKTKSNLSSLGMVNSGEIVIEERMD